MYSCIRDCAQDWITSSISRSTTHVEIPSKHITRLYCMARGKVTLVTPRTSAQFKESQTEDQVGHHFKDKRVQFLAILTLSVSPERTAYSRLAAIVYP